MAFDTSPKSLIDHFRHLTLQEKKEFIQLLRREMVKGDFDLSPEDWETFGLSRLREEWDQPENDFWDEEFKRQNPS
jgi:hypothetical protein